MALPQRKKQIRTPSPNIDEVKNNEDLETIKPLDESENLEVVDYMPLVDRQPLPKTRTEITGHDENPLITSEEEDLEKKEDKYIDKKKKKIIPLGGVRGKAKKYDSRKNKATSLKLFRAFLILTILGLFLFGLKNTFLPKEALTNDEIGQIAQNAVGETGFPTERGKAYVQQFITYYLKLNADDLSNKAILNYYYNGNNDTGSSQTTTISNSSGANKQDVIGTPVVYYSKATSKTTGLYKVSALVTDDTGSTMSSDGQTFTAHWVSFSVNVYYNKEKDSLSIHTNSPTIIPTYEITDNSKLPDADIIGNGNVDDDIKEKIKPTIIGYLKAYASSSVSNHNDIIQYIPEKADVSLYSGFNNTVTLANTEDDVSSLSNLTVYKTDKNNEWKVDVTVIWKDNKSIVKENSANYTSRYIITLKKYSNSKFLVTKFAPYIYTTVDKKD